MSQLDVAGDHARKRPDVSGAASAQDTRGACTIALSGDAGIRAAIDVAQRLKDGLARHGRVLVDTSELTRADITTVQTLLAARRQALAAGGEVELLVPVADALAVVLRAGGFLAAGQGDAGFWPVAMPDEAKAATPGCAETATSECAGAAT